ncbi:MAG: Uma2 family endonuclease [Isosphaeraceae bacterium]
MASAIASAAPGIIAEPPTMDAIIERLGRIPLSRVLSHPAPGLATEADLIEAQRKYDRLYELIDGILVEKGMGFAESVLAGALIEILRKFVIPRNLGLVSTPDGMFRLFGGLVRIPDVAFTAWERLPDRKVPKTPIPSLAPDLAVEILSESNTGAEMERKRGEYFASGVRLIWEVDPEARTVAVYTPDGLVEILGASQQLDGRDVLPGFTLDLGKFFAELDRLG